MGLRDKSSWAREGNLHRISEHGVRCTVKITGRSGHDHQVLCPGILTACISKEKGEKMQKINSDTHGWIDYIASGALLALPRLAHWPTRITNVMSAVGLATLGVSLMTRYEHSLVKIIPFKAHLTTDVMQALLFIAAPALFADEKGTITRTMVGLGLAELTIVAMTNPDAKLNGQR